MDAPVDGPAMTVDQTTRALHPKCHSEMVYVTAYPNATSNAVNNLRLPRLQQTRSYMLEATRAAVYAAAFCSQRDRIHRSWSDLN